MLHRPLRGIISKITKRPTLVAYSFHSLGRTDLYASRPTNVEGMHSMAWSIACQVPSCAHCIFAPRRDAAAVAVVEAHIALAFDSASTVTGCPIL